jgi:hypothetical protein
MVSGALYPALRAHARRLVGRIWNLEVDLKALLPDNWKTLVEQQAA